MPCQKGIQPYTGTLYFREAELKSALPRLGVGGVEPKIKPIERGASGLWKMYVQYEAEAQYRGDAPIERT